MEKKLKIETVKVSSKKNLSQKKNKALSCKSDRPHNCC